MRWPFLRTTEEPNEDSFTVSKDIERFNELKVGQKVNLTYYESVVFQLVKAGEKGSGASVGATATTSP